MNRKVNTIGMRIIINRKINEILLWDNVIMDGMIRDFFKYFEIGSEAWEDDGFQKSQKKYKLDMDQVQMITAGHGAKLRGERVRFG